MDVAKIIKLLFIILMAAGFWFGLRIDAPWGEVWGAGAGMFAAIIISSIINAFTFNATTYVQLDPDEELVWQGYGNHYSDWEAVGGKLYLTDKRLLFKAHAFNINNHQWEEKLDHLDHAEPIEIQHLLDSGIKVTTQTGHVEKFLVDQRDKWLRKLRDHILRAGKRA